MNVYREVYSSRQKNCFLPHGWLGQPEGPRSGGLGAAGLTALGAQSLDCGHAVRNRGWQRHLGKHKSQTDTKPDIRSSFIQTDLVFKWDTWKIWKQWCFRIGSYWGWNTPDLLVLSHSNNTLFPKPALQGLRCSTTKALGHISPRQQPLLMNIPEVWARRGREREGGEDSLCI